MTVVLGGPLVKYAMKWYQKLHIGQDRAISGSLLNLFSAGISTLGAFIEILWIIIVRL